MRARLKKKDEKHDAELRSYSRSCDAVRVALMSIAEIYTQEKKKEIGEEFGRDKRENKARRTQTSHGI